MLTRTLLRSLIASTAIFVLTTKLNELQRSSSNLFLRENSPTSNTHGIESLGFESFSLFNMTWNIYTCSPYLYLDILISHNFFSKEQANLSNIFYICLNFCHVCVKNHAFICNSLPKSRVCMSHIFTKWKKDKFCIGKFKFIFAILISLLV